MCNWWWIIVAGLLAISAYEAHSRPSGQWAQATPERQEFFKNAMRPDLAGKDGRPHSPCCAEADAYEADDFDTDEAGNLYAILTCNEPENCTNYGTEPGEREFVAPGTKIFISPNKIIPPRDPINKTGHGWVFYAATQKFVFCYALPGGY
jgi:hypothetical protein